MIRETYGNGFVTQIDVLDTANVAIFALTLIGLAVRRKANTGRNPA
ncbi:MAG: hypothetical protein QF552_02370 [Litorilituus sp.]|jgi:hypothetical protein|nr:hypothetical protein [Litorilituus sp.]